MGSTLYPEPASLRGLGFGSSYSTGLGCTM